MPSEDKLREDAAKLRDEINNVIKVLKEHHHRVNVAKTASCSASVLGGVLFVTGALLAVPTGGLSLAAAGAGAAVAGVGGVTSIGTSFVEYIIEKINISDIQKNWEKFQNDLENHFRDKYGSDNIVKKILECIRDIIKGTIDAGNGYQLIREVRQQREANNAWRAAVNAERAEVNVEEAAVNAEIAVVNAERAFDVERAVVNVGLAAQVAGAGRDVGNAVVNAERAAFNVERAVENAGLAAEVAEAGIDVGNAVVNAERAAFNVERAVVNAGVAAEVAEAARDVGNAVVNAERAAFNVERAVVNAGLAAEVAEAARDVGNAVRVGKAALQGIKAVGNASFVLNTVMLPINVIDLVHSISALNGDQSSDASNELKRMADFLDRVANNKL